MSTLDSGRKAETKAVAYLKNRGFKIHAQNWRTRYCEIDIVAEKSKVIYFIEVKYRQSDKWGGGLEYITPKKLKQMQFAAEMWVHEKSWQGDYQLAAVGISDEDIEFIEI